MQVHSLYRMNILAVTAAMAVVVAIAAATAVVGVAFDVIVGTTGTGAKVAVAATDQSKVVFAVSDVMVAVP